MLKHIDVFALFVIVLGVLAFARVPEVRFAPQVRTAAFQARNAVEHKNVCIFSEAIASFFR